MSFVEGLSIPRRLDLSRREDRRDLFIAAEELPELHSLLAAYLDDYCRLLPAQSWQTVYSGGFVVAARGRRGTTLSVLDAMHLARTLVRLESLPGFGKLVEHFGNPTQVSSAIFEARAAAWCADREVTLSIELHPSTQTKGGSITRPDFLWHTRLGDLYCECKRGATLEAAATERLERIYAQLARSYDRFPVWNDSFRLNVSLVTSATNEATRQIDSLVEQAHEADAKGRHARWEYSSKHVRAGFSLRAESLDGSRDGLIMGRSIAGTQATSIVSTTDLSLAMPVGSHRLRMLTKLVRRARRQLPEDARGAVLLEMSSTSGLAEKLKELVAQDEHSRTPWISLWRDGAIISAAWRSDQPFDGVLLE